MTKQPHLAIIKHGAEAMLIIGYRGSPDWAKVKAALKRCTDLEPEEINRIIATVKKGQTYQMSEDFVLRDELKDLGVIIK